MGTTNFDAVAAATFTGAVVGNVTGNITGDVTGNVTGNLAGQHKHSTQTLAASGAITINSGLAMLAHATIVIEATLDAPAAGDELYIVDTSATGTAAHTVTVPAGVTWDGSHTIATFNAPGEALHVIALSATRWLILENIGEVVLS